MKTALFRVVFGLCFAGGASYGIHTVVQGTPYWWMLPLFIVFVSLGAYVSYRSSNKGKEEQK